MINKDKTAIDRKFRSADPNSFRRLADDFAFEVAVLLKNMPEDWPEEHEKAIYDDYMEKYRYIQQIARERFGEPRKITYTDSII